MYWSAIETNVGILAASIPSFKSLAKRCLPRLIGEYSSKTCGTGKEAFFKGGKGGLQNIESSRSGFFELGERNGSHHGSGDIAMNALYGRPVGIDTSCDSGNGGHRTSIASSEEIVIILPPAGKILAQTHISIRSDA